ncbi:MAG: hypothetical protein ABR583_12770 [Gaiellaceae bacterium]
MSRFLVAATALSAGLTLAPAAGSFLDPTAALESRPVRPATSACDPCRVDVKNLVIGVTARPHVQRPASASAPQRVLRPRVLVPGQARADAR